MIDRNTTIPCKKQQTFSNAAPMQPEATILIGQGERKMFNDNKLLGQFNVELTPMPNPGQNQIEITYELDANGILTVEAFDKALNKKANITITSSSGLSKEEIEKAKADAEAHAAEDEKKLELVNEKNRAESLCNSIERAFKDVPADKITEDEKKPVVDAIAKVREVIKTDDIEKIKSEVEAMNKLYEPLASKLYQSAGGTVGPDGNPQFTQEQMEQMMKDPKFAQMFGGMNGNSFTGNTTTTDSGTVDAEFTEK
jgi:molecular chaperone DnaK